MKKAILSLQKEPSSDGSFCREMDEMDIRTCLKNMPQRKDDPYDKGSALETR